MENDEIILKADLPNRNLLVKLKNIHKEALFGVGLIKNILFQTSRSLRKRQWKETYDDIARSMPHKDFEFMNLGFSCLDINENVKTSEEFGQLLRRLSEQLYRHVIGDYNLKDKEVLEIGCGRGGGSAFIMKEYNPQKMISVDLSDEAIKLCQKYHQINGLHFQTADAMCLPFENNSFDVVINIESSHCYPSLNHFYSEVARVLRPEGLFLYADLCLGMPEIDKLNKRLCSNGFAINENENISNNVLRGRDLLSEKSDSLQKLLYSWAEEKYKQRFDLSLFNKLNDFSWCLKGTLLYEKLRAGKAPYWSWKLKKAKDACSDAF